jgi:excisionase family DNA binding protein
MREIYTINQVAQNLQISDDTIRRLIRRGEMDAVRVGKRLRIADWQIEEFLRRQSLSENKPNQAAARKFRLTRVTGRPMRDYS